MDFVTIKMGTSHRGSQNIHLAKEHIILISETEGQQDRKKVTYRMSNGDEYDVDVHKDVDVTDI